MVELQWAEARSCSNHLSSAAGLRSIRTQTSFVAYGAAKAALDRLTRNMASASWRRVLRLNAIERWRRGHPLRSRWCSPTTRLRRQLWKEADASTR